MTKKLSRLLAAMTCAPSLSVYATSNETDESRKSEERNDPSQVAFDSCENSTEKHNMPIDEPK